MRLANPVGSQRISCFPSYNVYTKLLFGFQGYGFSEKRNNRDTDPLPVDESGRTGKQHALHDELAVRVIMYVAIP